ncbi:MAG TPA: DinB family protein [Candidatus Limnocylindrales bacterium]|nr:DinB family protein [Candidatus Limnocylindrales bacterium]
MDEILTQLEEHPRRLLEISAAVPGTRLGSVPCLGTWSANDVLTHLRCCADAGAAAIRGLARTDGRIVSFVGPRTLFEEVDYRDRDFAANLRALTRQRRRLLALLRDLPRASWTRDGRTSDGGPARVRSILDYGQWLARHERKHVEALARFASKGLS